MQEVVFTTVKQKEMQFTDSNISKLDFVSTRHNEFYQKSHLKGLSFNQAVQLTLI